MTIYWSSTKSPRNLFRRGCETPELNAAILEARDVDPVIIAQNLSVQSMSRHNVASYQRRLGLRKFTGNASRKTP